MTTKDHLGDEKLHSLHNYIPASKNLTSRSQVTMGTDKVLEISKSDISKTLRFTTKSQVVAAILRRMNAMLRNPVKSSPGFIEQRERGAFLEYCTYLHHLMYETSIGGVVELDRMLMQSRQDGEWKNFGPIPDRIRHIKWPAASPITCAFVCTPRSRARYSSLSPASIQRPFRGRQRPDLRSMERLQGVLQQKLPTQACVLTVPTAFTLSEVLQQAHLSRQYR
jgi:hypothetical protein